MQENKEVRMARIENDEAFLDQLKRHEGLRLEAYLCPAGKLTIGWGHNCEAKPVPSVEKEGDVVSRGTAEILLYQDVKALAHELDDKLPWWRKMEEPRQAVLLNMAFNMGVPKLLGFKRFLAAAEAEDWNAAAYEMGDSKWAEQVINRSRELITQMILGAWQEA
jgi:lysozyme